MQIDAARQPPSNTLHRMHVDLTAAKGIGAAPLLREGPQALLLEDEQPTDKMRDQRRRE